MFGRLAAIEKLEDKSFLDFFRKDVVVADPMLGAPVSCALTAV